MDSHTSSQLGHAVLLGIVQGIAEFLPISSSGHLALMQYFSNFQGPELLYDLMLHVGTMAAVIWYYRSDFLQFAYVLPDLFGKPIQKQHNSQTSFFGLVILTTFITAVLGKVFESSFESMFENIRWVSGALVATSGLLLFAHFKTYGTRKIDDLTKSDAIWIGVAQALAIAPGISRSGATIAIALFLGVAPSQAARYSLVVSVPIIAAASLYEVLTKPIGLMAFGWPLIIGMLISAAVGLVAIRMLISALINAKLIYFSIYCAGLGILTLVL